MSERKQTPGGGDTQPNSACVEFGCSRKPFQLLQRKRSLRVDRREARMLPLHALRVVHPSGLQRRRAAGPERRRQGQDQRAGARGQGTAHRQRNPEEDVGLFCPSGARPSVPQMIAFIEEHREA